MWETELLEEKAVYVTCTDPTKEYVGNACVPKCGDGATRGEGGVWQTCTRPYKQSNVGNACVPKCGDGAY